MEAPKEEPKEDWQDEDDGLELLLDQDIGMEEHTLDSSGGVNGIFYRCFLKVFI